MKEVLIITGLPFRKQGNQSMIRFVRMFLNRGVRVNLFTSGKDKRGEHILENELFSFQYIPKVRDNAHELIKKILFLFKEKQRAGAIQKKQNYYTEIKSETIVAPFGFHNRITMLNKWSYYLLNILDNILALCYFLLFHRKALKRSTAIIAYEINYAIVARWLSRIFHKKYINKYQGVILAASNRDLSICKKYYPGNYYGINKSDLCLMVNDGTDGEYYAKERGCKRIYFEPHGVNEKDYNDSTYPEFQNANTGKFIIFNNASGSKWKRSDRCIRFIKFLSDEVKNKIKIYTTYHAEDVNELKEYVNIEGVNEQVNFLAHLDHIASNKILRNSHILLMTNDLSNLGNPVLEAIYFGVPVVSLNDNSLNGFITNNVDGVLLGINEGFDQKLAQVVERLCSDPKFYESLKENVKQNISIHTVDYQQEKEFKVIYETISG